ncbi:hypothetical protein FBQ87_10895, partial [Sphingobacteriales bacterium CHB3]|nr:hypothetical protein [Sphingobacteriales bacterium CHB3]
MNKEEIQKRHAAIKSLIASKDISNQTELVNELKRKRIDVTQATLSRDLAELGIIRMPTEHGYRYEIRTTGPEPVLRGFTAEEVISVESNENLIVIKTFPGRAQGGLRKDHSFGGCREAARPGSSAADRREPDLAPILPPNVPI